MVDGQVEVGVLATVEKAQARCSLASSPAMTNDPNPFGSLADSAADSNSEGPWDIVGNRQTVSTGGRSNMAQDQSSVTVSDDLSSDAKLNLILSKMSVSENRFDSLEKKIDSVISLRSHVNNIGSVVHSHAQRIKLLEY